MKRLLILTILGVALIGCSGESSITSTYGSSAISGEVIVTGITNTNPAGIEVSVRGTGMTAILGVDGQFAFANIPDGADLDFRRAEDGIDASIRVDASSGFVTVDLTARKARRRSGAKGGAPATGRPVREYEGTVLRATARELVILTANKQEVTFILTADTVIRRNSTTFDLRQILVGLIVQVTAVPNADGTHTATLVVVRSRAGS
ncbi:MAG TPA: DUF5666 domain-containing protein [Thermoanaerobaculia bacterium]|jgi:hypothetical protein|nr:DUF5666 domain-containing protein [Thermoanaerobaculia bacterium]